MKGRNTYLLIGLVVAVNTTLHGQQFVLASVADQIYLSAEGYSGNLQWEYSTDGLAWLPLAGATSQPYQVIIEQLPVYYRASVDIPGCEVPLYSDEVHVLASSEIKRWSVASHWPDGKPQVEDDVLIPSGEFWLLDETPPPLGRLTVEGALHFDDMDLELTAERIWVTGELRVGHEESPFAHTAVITLTGADRTGTNMDERGIVIAGGRLELHGKSPQVVHGRLAAHASAGASTIQLADTPDWEVGDEIVIAPTDYYEAGFGASFSQKVSLMGINSTQIEISEGLNAHRWGMLQYATANGMSLTPNELIEPPLADTESRTTPVILDERATVAHISRNIIIQAPDDQEWNSFGFGVHVMIMKGTGGKPGTAHVEGVEIRRGGQRSKLGRYPFHWHMLSYQGSQTLADAAGQYIRNSSIVGSRNRGIVIHGTNGVLVQNNVVFDIQGHGIFTEDAVERRNIIDGNLVLKVRNPPFGSALKLHESGERGSSGFWISNPDNTVINNLAADCATNGFWLAFTDRPWGESSSVLDEDGLLLNPSRLLFGVFDNNTAHSNGMEGINLDLVEADEEGNVKGFIYSSTTNGRNGQWPFPNRRRFSVSNFSVWKNSHRGFWDSSTWVDTFGGVSADNCERYFAGRGEDGLVERCLVVGTSLNHLMNGTDRPFHKFGNFHNNGESVGTPVAFATYHSTFDIRGNVVVDFGDAVPNTWSGAFATDDYYTRAVERGQVRNVDNLLVNTHPGVKLRSSGNYFTLASALWDPYGMWGPAGNYLVYDDPFLTYGKEVHEVAPGSASVGGVSVQGPFYGFSDFVLHGVGDSPPQNQPYMDLMGLHVERLTMDFTPVAQWDVAPAPSVNSLLQHMRDFAASPDGIYELSFSWLQPQNYPSHPTHLQMLVENMLTEQDTLIMSVQFEGSLEPTVRLWVYNGYVVNYSKTNTLDELLTAPGEAWYQDKESNKVWIKLRGGRWAFWTNDSTVDEPDNDELLYQPVVLQIY